MTKTGSTSVPLSFMGEASIVFEQNQPCWNAEAAVRVAKLLARSYADKLPVACLDTFHPQFHFQGINVDIMYETKFLNCKGPITRMSKSGQWDAHTITSRTGEYPVGDFVNEIIEQIGVGHSAAQAIINGPGIHHCCMLDARSATQIVLCAIEKMTGTVSVYVRS